MRCSEPGGSVEVAIDASWRRVAELLSLGGMTRMKITRYKVRLGLGLLFTVFGLLMAVSSFIGAITRHKSHGWNNIIQVGVVGVLLVVTGVGLCYDKDAA